MHTYVHGGTVYNSKDLEPIQMPINDRLDRENVTYISHGILFSHKKWWVCALCMDMDEPGNHHSQQTYARTENQKSHVLTHWQVLNNENTWTREGSITQGGTVGSRELRRDSLGRNAKCGWRGERKQNTLPCVYLRNSLACSVHVPQNLKCNKKLKKKKFCSSVPPSWLAS